MRPGERFRPRRGAAPGAVAGEYVPAPENLEGEPAEECRDDGAHQAAEQERLPDRGEFVLEPVPVGHEVETMARHGQQGCAHAVREVVDRHGGEGVQQERRAADDRQVQPPQQRHRAGARQVHRQRDEADRQPRGEGVSHVAPVQGPQLRVREALGERSQQPQVPQRRGVRDDLLQEPARHRAADSSRSPCPGAGV